MHASEERERDVLLTAKVIAVSRAAALLLLEVSEHDVGNVLELLVHLSNGDLERFQKVDLLILNYSPDTCESEKDVRGGGGDAILNKSSIRKVRLICAQSTETTLQNEVTRRDPKLLLALLLAYRRFRKIAALILLRVMFRYFTLHQGQVNTF